jgi:hypothetical protein
MSEEMNLLRSEIYRIKNRIQKCDRRILNNKANLNGESEVDRKNRLAHILCKKEERFRLLEQGQEV